MSPESTQPWSSRRLLFVTGKGGVGKTSVTAAMALALASRGQRVLAATCGVHERLSAMFGVAPLDHTIRQVADKVWAVRIEPEHAMEEYGVLVLKVRALARAVFDNKYTHTFFRAVPGLYEWAMLGKAWYHTTETRSDGTNRFDVVLFDAPSTGHGLDMLRVPRVILDIVPPGILRRDAEQAWQLLSDPTRSGVVVVSLAGDMPTTETLQLVDALRTELQLPIACTVINGVDEQLFTASQRVSLLADESRLDPDRSSGQGEAQGTLVAAATRAERERRQAFNVDRLRAAMSDAPLVLPRLVEGAGTPAGTAVLARALKGEADAE